MMRSLTALRCVAAASLLCATSVAQTRFCTGGDLEHLSPTQKAQCSAKLQTLRTVAATLKVTNDWHFVLVCGEEGWKQYSSYAFGNDAGLKDAAANTDAAAHETFFRESRLDLGDVAATRELISREVDQALHASALASVVLPSGVSQRSSGSGTL